MTSTQGHRLLHFRSIDSTNIEARRQFEKGDTGPLWIWAEEQTGGKGRLGRHWVSEPGNLYVTYLFQSEASSASASQLGFVAALAVHDAVKQLLPRADLLLKWPNDVLLGGAKLCGLLAEVLQPHPLTIAMGCGVNIAHSPQGLPYPATHLGHGLKPETVLAALQAALLARLGQWEGGLGFAAIRSAWLERAMPRGTPISVNGEQGTFAGLAASGALLLKRPDGAIAELHAGDVMVPPGVVA